MRPSSEGGNDGYGNRLPGVAMALVWALLTDRVLLVHWRDTYPQPVPWGQLFAPGGGSDGGGALEMDVAKLLAQLAPLQGHVTATTAGCKARGAWSTCAVGCSGRAPASTTAHLQAIRQRLLRYGYHWRCRNMTPRWYSYIPSTFNLCAHKQRSSGDVASPCYGAVTRDTFKAIASKNLKKVFPEQVLLFKSDDYSMPLLTNNPMHRAEVARLMGGAVGNIFGHAARWLLQPAPAVQATARRGARRYLASACVCLPGTLSTDVQRMRLCVQNSFRTRRRYTNLGYHKQDIMDSTSCVHTP